MITISLRVQELRLIFTKMFRSYSHKCLCRDVGPAALTNTFSPAGAGLKRNISILLNNGFVELPGSKLKTG